MEQLEIGTIARFCHLLLGDEAQSAAVDAITLSAFFAWSIVENMSQMGITQFASHLGARHAMRQIGVLGEQIVADGARKAGQPQPESYLSDERNSGCPVVMST